jgi:hypothetical protein
VVTEKIIFSFFDDCLLLIFIYNMLGHFIRYKGKGIWVIVLPLLICLTLAQLLDFFHFDDRYLGGVSFCTSGIILFFMDNGRKTVTEGMLVQKVVKLPREKRKNTLMWIEVRYWAIILFVIGVVWMVNV